MAENNQNMNSSFNEQPIIIKKRAKKGHAGGHGGAWKVAYADFVTAMMAFFIVMWILASSEETKMQVKAYFDDPGAFNFLTGKLTVPIDLDLEPQKKQGDSDKSSMMSFDDELADTLTNRLIEKSIKDSIQATKKVKGIADRFGEYINDMIAREPDMKEILKNIKIEMTKEGLRIELIERNESVFFEVGRAQIKPEAKKIFSHLAKEIGKLPNYVEIEGHTDSRAYVGKNYSNWELSTDRANSVRKLLSESGLWEGQTQKVTGFADRKLYNQDNPFDISNRRVSILIRQLTANNFLPTASEVDNAVQD